MDGIICFECDNPADGYSGFCELCNGKEIMKLTREKIGEHLIASWYSTKINGHIYHAYGFKDTTHHGWEGRTKIKFKVYVDPPSITYEGMSGHPKFHTEPAFYADGLKDLRKKLTHLSFEDIPQD